MKRLVIIFSIILCSLAALFLWACAGIQLAGIVDEKVYDFGSGPASGLRDPGKLSVLTWNISYAYGFGSSGKGYVARTLQDLNSRLQRIGEIIRDSKADIVLLQEIDFNSHRSRNVDQMKELSRITGLRYAAPAVSWKAGYVPFPLWPLKYHFGAVRSGGAVLSRYPIAGNRTTLYPKPAKNPWWYNLFYLFRYSQQVWIQRDNREYQVINNHLETYDKERRMQQARNISRMVAKFNPDERIIIIGGDMNTVPSGARMQYGFPDGTVDDFRQDATLAILNGISGFKEVVAEDTYRSNEAAFFTFPAHAPNRRLDYLFVPEGIPVIQVRIISTGDLSDHLPVLAELAVKK